MYQAPKLALSDSIPSQFSSEQYPLFYKYIFGQTFAFAYQIWRKQKETNFKKITSKFGLVEDCVSDLETYLLYTYTYCTELYDHIYRRI